MSKLYDRVVGALRWTFDHRIHAPHQLDIASNFPGAGKFISRWTAIRDEALVLSRSMARIPRLHDVMQEQADISAADEIDWRIFVLKAYGAEIPRNMACCPILCAVLRDSPEVLSATISFLAPGKHVPRHSGPFRGIMRFHLGLSMPRAADGRPGSVLMVEDSEYRIDDGAGLLWDDTYPHEVWNDTNQVRIALLLDVWRPGMPADMRLLSHLIVTGVRWTIRLRGLPGAG